MTYSGFEAHGRLASFCRLIDRRTDLDVLVAPEWMVVPSEGMHSARSMERIRHTLREKTQGKNMLVIPGTIAWTKNNNYSNTTLAVSNGKILCEYTKRHEGGDYSFAKDVGGVKWKAGTKQGLFRWRGLDVGVEICNDHFRGQLASENPAHLDLYVVLACTHATKMYEKGVPRALDGTALFCNGGSGAEPSLQALTHRHGRTIGRLSEKTVDLHTKRTPMMKLGIFDVSINSLP